MSGLFTKYSGYATNFFSALLNMGTCLSQPLQKIPNTAATRSASLQMHHTNHHSNSRNSHDKKYHDHENHNFRPTDDSSDKYNTTRIQSPDNIRLEKNQNIYPESGGVNNPQIRSAEEVDVKDSNGNMAKIGTDQSRPYFSFTSFILQNEKPQIYEWLFLNEVDKGSLSQVFTVKHTEYDEMYAAKVYNNAVLHRQTIGNEDPPYVCIQREIEALSKLFHPNVLTIMEVIEDELTNSLILIEPYAALGKFSNNRLELSLQNVLCCFYQICEGLRYVHEMGFVHRNLRPDCILMFDEFYYVLSDFKLAERIFNFDEKTGSSDTRMFTDVRGSLLFLSPEECKGVEYDARISDVWSFGVSFYYSLFGKLPFNLAERPNLTTAHILHNLEKENLEFPQADSISNDIRDLISRLLEKDLEKRITLEECSNSSVFDEAREITNLNNNSRTVSSLMLNFSESHIRGNES